MADPQQHHAEPSTTEQSALDAGVVADLTAAPPPPAWGVHVDSSAIESLAERWSTQAMPLPQFDYPGTPDHRDESWWYDYVTVSVAVLACLWPPEGHQTWAVRHHGRWLDDAPGIFAVFTRLVDHDNFDLHQLAAASATELTSLFESQARGTLQLMDERVATIQSVARTIVERWDGSTTNLVDAANYDGKRIARLLTNSFPAYHDRPTSPHGILPFDKLAHLGAAVMAAGIGWERFTGYQDFPVYPDYMLPRVLRHFGAIAYQPTVAAAVDNRQPIAPNSPNEHAIRWATVYTGHQLLQRLRYHGNPVAAPGLDYFLWWQAVLGPDATELGEHHRTVTMRY